MTQTLLAPVFARKSLTNTYHYAGGTITILLSGADTNGQFSVWEGVQKPGAEPPLHVHHSNDETFFVLEGHMRFMVGDQIVDASPGSVVFLPRGVPHAFKIKSPQATVMTLCTPSGFEEWFQTLGRPATTFDLPDRVEPPSESEVARMIALGRKLHTEVLRPVDF